MDGGQWKTVFKTLKNGPPKEIISVYVYAIFRIFSPLNLAVRQPFPTGTEADILLPSKLPYSFDKNSNFTMLNTGVAGLPLF